VAGSYCSFLIDSDGVLWAWGNNEHEQLGDGTSADRRNPVKIMSNVSSVASKGTNSFAVKTDGSLWAWGRSGYNYSSSEPIKIMENVTSAATGGLHNLFVQADGSLWARGNNYSGQLGNGRDSWLTNGRYDNSYVHEPIKIIDDVIADGVISVAAGESHSLVLTSYGSLFVCGYYSFGCSYDGYSNGDGNSVLNKILDDVVSIATGENHSLAIKADGSLWTWGNNEYGQLGDGTTSPEMEPIKIMDGVNSVAAGSWHNLAVKEDGSLWAWGDNYYGQLGDGTEAQRNTPVKIMDEVAFVAAGERHSYVIKTDGSLWAWGNNYYGQLGDGTAENRNTPTKIMDNVDQIEVSRFTEEDNSTESPQSLGKWRWIEDKGKRNLSDYEDYELLPYHDEHTQKYGYKDLFDNIVIEPEFDEAFKFNQGLARIGKLKNDLSPDDDYIVSKYKYTYIDKKGNFIKDYTWDIAYEFNSFGVATVGIGEVSMGDLLHFSGKYGLIDKTGSYVKPLTWNGDFAVRENQMSKEGLMPVGVPQKIDEYGNYLMGYADYNGNIAIQPQWEYATGFTNGLAIVSLQDMVVYQYFSSSYDDEDDGWTGRYAVIDTTGNVVLDITRDLLKERGRFHVNVDIINGEYIRVGIDGSQGETIYLDLNGSIIPKEEALGNQNINFNWYDNLCLNEDTDKYGIHSGGRIIVEPIFDELKNNDSWVLGYVSYNGENNVYYAKLGDKEGYIYIEGE